MIKKVFAFLFLSVPAFAGYNYTTPLIVNHGQVGGIETNFPVLFSTNSVLMSTATAGGHMLNSNGYDLVFSTWSDCHYLLHWDSETVNTTGTAQMNVWVQVPSLSNTTDTVFYACYGNAAITTYQGISSATWNNYAAVYHLPNGSTLSGVDSSSGGNILTNSGGTATTGVIDGGLNVTSGNGMYSSAGALNTYPQTMESWVKLQSTSYNTESFIMGEFGNNYYVWYEYYAIHGDLRMVSLNNGGGVVYESGWAYPVLDTNWHEITAVFTNATTNQLYFDGVAATYDGNTAGTGTPLVGLTNIIVAGQSPGFGEIAGSLDESRLYNGALTSDWISTEYNNQSNPSGFIIFDTEINNTIPGENEKGIILDGGKMTIKGGRLTVR